MVEKSCSKSGAWYDYLEVSILVILDSLLKKYPNHPRAEIEALSHLEAVRLMERYISSSLFNGLLKALK